MSKDLTISIEDEQHCATIIEHSRHGGSTPLARSPSESSTYDGSVEASVEQPKEIATESGHWYLPDGTPFYTTERRSGKQKGEKRAVSLRHDRKLLMSLCAVPSVTTITRILEKPALVEYKLQCLYTAMLDNPKLNGESDEDYYDRVCQVANEHRNTRASRGSEMHTAIEHFLLGKDISSSPWKEHVDEAVKALTQYGITLGSAGVSEHSFAHDCGTGCYGGKVDYHERMPAGLVIDFKSKEEITDKHLAGTNKLAYDEHAMQLAAYREGLGIPEARGINVFVGERDRRVFIYEHRPSDLARGMRLFRAVLEVWKIKNNYYVRI